MRQFQSMDSPKRGIAWRPFAILTAGFVVIVIIVGAVVWKVTKDTYEPDNEAIYVTGVTTVSPETTALTTKRPLTEEEIRESPWLSLRMLRDVLPVHYDITIFPDFYGINGLFYGNETVELRVDRPTRHILFHVHTNYMNVTSAQVVDNVTQASLAINRTFPYKPNEFYVIEMLEEIKSPVKVMLQFEGSLTKSIMGLYKGTYVNTKTKATHHLAASKFEPTYARRAYPCFDEPDIKAEYTVSLLHKSGYIALSNMPEDGQITAALGRPDLQLTRFQRSVEMSTYLVTFVVGEFDHVNTTSQRRGIPIRAFATPDKLSQTELALNMAKHTLDKYEELYGIDYPLPKQDLIAIPEFVSGAMEHWGLIAFRESRMLYDENSASLSDAEDVAHVVAHEMAHMWFGNLVTMAWWNDLWLNEGFASYMEYIGAATNANLSDWGLMEKFLTSDFYRVMPQDSALSSHPIIVDVDHPDQITSVFDAISYSKGASVIRMLHGIMGETKFFAGVNKYLEAHKWGNAETDDLWGAMTEVEPRYDVKHIMDTWTIQDGYPYINISLEQTSGASSLRVTATQKRFLLGGEEVDESASPLGYKWYVPLDYRTATGHSGSHTLDMVDGQFDIANPGDWVKFNRDQGGFYRVLYPDDIWSKLSGYLKTTDYDSWSLSIEDRAGLLNDAYSLASAGLTDYSIPLVMTSYLEKEQHLVPWSAAVSGGMSYIRRMLVDDPDFGLWKRFIGDQTRPVLNRLGFTDTGTHIDRQVRALALALSAQAGDALTVSNVTQMFRDWLDNGVTPTVNLRNAVYRYGMYHAGTDADWNTIWEKYKVENSPQEKNLLATTLSMATKPHLISRLLDLANQEKDIKRQDFFTLVYNVGNNPAARGIVFDWARENYQTFVDRYTINDRSFGRMLYYMTRDYNSQFKLQEVEDFFRLYPEAGAGQRYREMTVDSIKTNIKWMTTYRPQVLEWLKRKESFP